MKKMAGALVGILLVSGLLYLGISTDAGAHDGNDGDGSARAAEAEGEGPASVVSFETTEGGNASLEDYRGDVVVLNFWGTWCPPCRREIPELVDLQEEIGPRGGTVIGIAVDSGTPEKIRSFLADFGAEYPIWISRTQEVVDHFDIMGFPTTLIIDRDGRIRARHLGPRTVEHLLEDVEPLL